MDWAVQICKLFGIPVRIHVTFMVLLLAVTLLGKQMGVPAAGQYYAMAMVCCMFGCVLVHELAHSLMARRFGVKVENITLLPIGGVASMTSMPRGPWQEVAIAITGPVASLTIAAGFLMVHVLVKGHVPPWKGFNPFSGGLISNLFTANLMLAAFNLIPAFPLDGGRALRGVLALFVGHERASRFALKLGEAIAVLFFLLGVYIENWLLPFVALFIYIGARQEREEVDLMVNLFKGTAADALVRNPRALAPDTTLADALEEFRHSAQHDFPVVQGRNVVGAVSRARLLAGMKEHLQAGPVCDIMDPHVILVELEDSLEQVYQEMREKDKDIVVVLADGELAGLIDQKQLDKYEQLGPTQP